MTRWTSSALCTKCLGDFRKVGSRKAAGKFEGIVFAKDRNHAEELVRKMISDYSIKPEEPVSIIGGSDKTLEEIYNERPELNGNNAGARIYL